MNWWDELNSYVENVLDFCVEMFVIFSECYVDSPPKSEDGDGDEDVEMEMEMEMEIEMEMVDRAIVVRNWSESAARCAV